MQTNCSEWNLSLLQGRTWKVSCGDIGSGPPTQQSDRSLSKKIPFGIDLFDKIPEVKEGIPQVLQTFWSGTDHYVLMAGPGRQFPNESPVRGSRFSREGRNHGEPEPWASKPAKLLRSSRYAETACRARAHLEPHSLPNSTSFNDWLEDHHR